MAKSKMKLFIATIWIFCSKLSNQLEADRKITVENEEFVVDGVPLRIISGSLDYFRVPAEYWRGRLRKMKAAGLNSVATYVEWSNHEPEERQYMFEGDRDVAQFVRTAAEEGLFVLLRAGPYICAERDMGGFPYWLIGKYPDIQLRSTDKNFMSATRIWLKKLFEVLTPFLYSNGGPIILVQIENEYGSYGSDEAYKMQLHDIFLEHVGDKALLYTTDGGSDSMVKGGKINGTVTTIDFGPGGSANNTFENLSGDLKGSPRMNSEFYTGWLTHWSEPQMAKVDKGAIISSLGDMLDSNVNVNFYMFCGGTNFEFYAGANNIDGYVPDVTSYDYDSPISESGDLTPKYHAIRDTLIKYYPEINKIPIPPPQIKLAYGKVAVKLCLRLLSQNGRQNLGKSYPGVSGSALPNFEQLRQRAGLMLYETTLNDDDGVLFIDPQEPTPDRVYVFVDGKLNGIISRLRKHSASSLTLKAKKGSLLSLLVENQGRIGYGYNWQIKDFKGLREVSYNNKPLGGHWIITGYPLQNVNDTCASPNDVNFNNGPVLFDGTFILAKGQKADTFFNPTGWGKGYVWVNGHNLGRYWPSMGPQVTLYVPGARLREPPASNHLRILELEQAPDSQAVEFVDHPIMH